MRRPSIYDRNSRRPLEIQMTPMIDVVFLLLVFFVYAASDQVVEFILPSQLSAIAGSGPSDATDPPPEKDFPDTVIKVRREAGGVLWSVNGESIATVDKLQTVLAGIAAARTDAPVIVHPTPSTPMGDVVQVYDLARIAGFEKVQFAATAK